MNLTRAQIAGMRRIRDRGSMAWCEGGRSGGAISRMFYRLVAAGLVSGPPYKITAKGRKALAALEDGETKP